MMIDKAVTAFHATNPRFTIKRSIVNTDKWVVQDQSGKRVTSGLGHTYEECVAIRDRAVTAAKLSAALQEMISVKTLSMAMMLAGAPDAGAVALAGKMMPKLIDLWSVEDGDVIDQPVGHA